MSDQFVPTIVIGLGGIGHQVLSLLKNNLLEENNGKMPRHVKILAFDTRSQRSPELSHRNNSDINFEKTILGLDHNEFIPLEDDLYEYARQVDDQRILFDGVNVRDLLNTLPRSYFALDAGAGRNRRLARLALFADLNRSTHGKILSALKNALDRARSESISRGPIQVCVVSSLAGGTGSSWLMDFPIILRQLANYLNTDLLLRAFVITPPNTAAFRELEATTFSAWRELDRLMSATPEQPVIIEYPKSEKFLGRVVLERPAYDYCHVFGENHLNNEFSVYPVVSDILLAFTYESFFKAYRAREVNNIKKFESSGKGQRNYVGLGVYSVKSSFYWLEKYIASQYLKEKLSEVFRFIPSDQHVSNWYHTPAISLEEGFHRFVGDIDLDNEKHLHIGNFLRSLLYLKDSGKRERDFHKSQIEILNKSLISIGENEIVRSLNKISTYDFRPLSDWRKHARSMDKYPSILQRNTNQIREQFFGADLSATNSLQGDFQRNLSVNAKEYYTLFVDVLARYGNRILQSEIDFDKETGPFGYFLWLLEGMQDVFRNALYSIEKYIDETQRHTQQSIDQQKIFLFQNLEKKSGQKILGRFGISRAINDYIDLVRRENKYLVERYALEENIKMLRMMIALVGDLIRQLHHTTDRFLLGRDSLLVELENIAQLYLAKRHDHAYQYRGARTEISDDASELLSQLCNAPNNFPLEWDIQAIENTSILFEINFLESKKLISRLGERRDISLNSLFPEFEAWSKNIVDEAIRLDNFGKRVIRAEDIPASMFQNSTPWLLPNNAIAGNQGNTYYLILGQTSQPGNWPILNTMRKQLGYIKGNVNEVFTESMSGLMLVQNSDAMSADEISSYRHCQPMYYQTGIREHELTNHILPAEISAFRYENQIASKYFRNVQPLSWTVVQLLQNEQLLELFVRAFAHEFIILNRNNEGEIWYQLSYPDLRGEIYLTVPERTQENPAFKIMQALSTFVLKGQDARTRYRETKINYSELKSLLAKNSKERRPNFNDETGMRLNIATDDEINLLSQFYKKFQESAQHDRVSLRNESFDDLLMVINIIIDRWKGVSYRAVAVAPKPIRKVSDHYVVAIPLKSESRNLFVGRQKYFEQIENIWKNQTQKASIILYGQRRMGKTSLLYQLESKLGSSYITILLDFQGIGPQVKKESDFWRLLAKLIHRGLEERKITIEQYIDVAEIKSSENFDDYLYAIEKDLGTDKWLVLLIDEFEKIEEKIDAGIVSTDIFDSLRHIIQHRDRIIILLAGHHTLQERLKQYWNPLMETAINVKLSYLSNEEAKQLIQSPWENFELKYAPQALERIVEVCGGQPLLIQLVCKGVINRVNQRLQKTGGEVIPMATRSDVESVLQRIVVAEDHDADTITFFFDAVWSWLKDDEKQYLIKLAGIAALENGGWIKTTDNAEILNRLVERDVLEKEDGGYRFRVDLLKQWVVDKYVK